MSAISAVPTESSTPVQDVLSEFISDLTAAVPRLLSGLVFLAVAYIVVRVILLIVRRLAERIYPGEEALIADLVVAVIGLFLWFGVLLGLLNVVGLEDVAASLGTAAGFVGLGIAFALKEMIADTVAGVYLLQDPNFNHGDRVEAASVTGTIVRIDLRKTRFRTDDGDLVVVANRDVEKRWTNQSVASGDVEHHGH